MYNTNRLSEFPIPTELSLAIVKGLKQWSNMSKTHMQYLTELKKMKANVVVPRKDNFVQYLRMALWAEEWQQHKNMEQYDLNDQKIIRTDDGKPFFKIHVEGLEEERPSVMVNDAVEIIDVENKKPYLFKVTSVLEKHIIAVTNPGFCLEYKADKLYHIKFRLNNYPFRCDHYALLLMNTFGLTPFLFPTQAQMPTEYYGNLQWFNKDVANNPEQKQAIFNIINKSSSNSPYILYGPPGTGKTATVVEAICQAWKKNTSKRILVCTPSNTTADVITKLLMAYIEKKNLYRIYSRSIDVTAIDKTILDCCNVKNDKTIRNLSAKDLPNIIITTLCTSTRLHFVRLPATDFSYVFIDEAGQATEPESMIPFTLLSGNQHFGKLCGQIVLAGDPKQLGPVVMSKISEPLLGKSMMERLMALKPYRTDENGKYNSRYITKLVQNYRCHPSIIHVPNKLFYNNELKACCSKNVRKGENWKGLPNPKFPIIFEEVMGKEVRDKRSPSVYNTDELKKVLSYIHCLLRSKLGDTIVKGKDIGIVTPFTEQKLKLQKMLKDAKISDIEIGTVQLFQGKEKEVIILTTVRSQIFKGKDGEHIGFLSNPRRLNVALTRAKSLLIVVGHPHPLSADENWSTLLDYCIDNNSYIRSSIKIWNKKERSRNTAQKSVQSTMQKPTQNPMQIFLVSVQKSAQKSTMQESVQNNQIKNSSELVTEKPSENTCSNDKLVGKELNQASLQTANNLMSSVRPYNAIGYENRNNSSLYSQNVHVSISCKNSISTQKTSNVNSLRNYDSKRVGIEKRKRCTIL